jgi:hypothetical protein
MLSSLQQGMRIGFSMRKISSPRLLELLNSAKNVSGASLREVGIAIDIDFTYISMILNGRRLPPRDILIALCAFGWQLDLPETNEILVAAGYPPLGKGFGKSVSA